MEEETRQNEKEQTKTHHASEIEKPETVYTPEKQEEAPILHKNLSERVQSLISIFEDNCSR
jgi:hypothetical protein